MSENNTNETTVANDTDNAPVQGPAKPANLAMRRDDGKPLTFAELPRITKDGKSVVDWSAVGLEAVTHHPETGEVMDLKRDNGIAVNGCVFLWARDAQKIIDAGLGDAIIANVNGTSWKVSQDDVNRAYDRECAQKGQRGAKVRETLEHRLWDRITGIRRKPDFRTVNVKTVTVEIVKMTLPDGKVYAPEAGMSREDVVNEYRSFWIDAMLNVGVAPNVIVGLADAQDFGKMLDAAGWKPTQEEAK